MNGRLERRLARLDYRIGAARGAVEVAYALDQHEDRKEAAFRHLEALIEERDALRRAWAEVLRPGGTLFGPGPGEIPVYDPEALSL